jgi:hypothetical protein
MNRRPKPDAKTKQVLMMMRFLAKWAFAWGIFDCILLLICFVESCASQEAAGELYGGMSAEVLGKISLGHYLAYLSFKLALLAIRTYIIFLLIKLLSRVNLGTPFNIEVARLLEKISYTLIGALIVVILQNIHYTGWMMLGKEITVEQRSILELFFMTGLVFIISRIFKRGVELQTENDQIV